MNIALKKWATEDIKPHQKRGNGRVSALARHLGLSQSAVTKMIDGSSQIQLKYIPEIISFTGISARHLLPEYYAFFKDSFKSDEAKLETDLSFKKKKFLEGLGRIKSEIEKLEVSV